ncbi:MAG TPA: hypothetical protein VED00_02645 [archaeon]|nr:hypothetical protein [archaeon]
MNDSKTEHGVSSDEDESIAESYVIGASNEKGVVYAFIYPNSREKERKHRESWMKGNRERRNGRRILL